MNDKIKIKLRKNSKTIPVIILGIVGMFLIIISYISNNATQKSSNNFSDENDEERYRISLERRLKETIDSITDKNCLSVMITFENGFESVYSNVNHTQTSSVFNQKEENTPQLLKTKNPKIAGVMIICNNIYDAMSITEIKNAAATCLNISQNKIYIIGGTFTQ